MRRSFFNSPPTTPPKRAKMDMVSGYVHDVSETQMTVQDKPFVHFVLQSAEGNIRGLCFSEALIEPLGKFETSEQGVSTDGQFKPDKKHLGKDVLMLNERSRLQETTLPFPRKSADFPMVILLMYPRQFCVLI